METTNTTQKSGLLAGTNSRVLARTWILAAIALVIYGLIRWLTPTQEMPVAGGGYYTGPMLRKGGIWVTADGKIVPPPAGWKPTPPPTGSQAPKPRLDL